MSERFFACSVLFCSVFDLFGCRAAVVVHTNEGKTGTRPWNSTKSISRSSHTLSQLENCLRMCRVCTNYTHLYLCLCERSMRCSNGLHHPQYVRACVCVFAYVLCTLHCGMPYLEATNCTVLCCRRLFHSFSVSPSFSNQFTFENLENFRVFPPVPNFPFSTFFGFVCAAFSHFQMYCSIFYPFKFIPFKWKSIVDGRMVMVIIA